MNQIFGTRPTYGHSVSKFTGVENSTIETNYLGGYILFAYERTFFFEALSLRTNFLNFQFINFPTPSSFASVTFME